MDPSMLNSLRWRCIGPHRGGRVVAVAGDPVQPSVFYFGAVGGGVWKTTDGGTYWENVSDGYFTTASVGAIAVSESDPNVLYVGSGEACIRGNMTHGDGVYKSTDGGRTWANVGLRDTRHIGRVRIHPNDPDLVYVAALGHAFGPNDERGVFRSKDGGASWDKVLFKSDKAGAVDLSIDPGNPRVLYASFWQALREPWMFTSGGPDSGLYRSTDGGDTWADLSDRPGMPSGVKGRIGVATSPARRGRVWAIVEAEDRAFLRSDDGGDTWERISENRDIHGRPWYYSHIFADPVDPETVYALESKFWKSTDSGRTFAEMTTPHPDNHDVWIDPRDPRRMIQGSDGGAAVTFNGGDSWSSIFNQPTSQFYHVTTDNQFPYRAYATQQDNNAISVPSRSVKGAILWTDCYPVGSAESGHVAVRPDDSNVVYTGGIGSISGGGDSLNRYDHRTGQTRNISVWPEVFSGTGPKDQRYRFQWTYPIVISPHDPNILYVAAEKVLRSENEGVSWEEISPDLTRGDVTKMEPSGGPLTLDTTSVEHYGTIFALAESPHEHGVFWAGSDDGLVHISRDGGQNWEDVTPPELPEWTRIDVIEVSPHDAATAYMAATRYKFDDPRPFLYKTADYGKTWAKITEGIPNHDFTRVVREDPVRRGLLYAGTETTVYVSFDGGASWQPLQGSAAADSDRALPVVPISDLVVKGDELVVATNGRSFWVLDDLPALRQIHADPAQPMARLLKPAPTYRIAPPVSMIRKSAPGLNYSLAHETYAAFREAESSPGETAWKMLDAGANPPAGVVVSYYLNGSPTNEVALAILDAKGDVVRRFSSASDPDSVEPTLPTESGMNRFVWDMRNPVATSVEGGEESDVPLGPLAPPGEYQVELSVDDETLRQTFELVKDPNVEASQADLQGQLALSVAVRDKLSEVNEAVNRTRSLGKQIAGWAERAEGHADADKVSEAAKALKEKLETVDKGLVSTRTPQGTNDPNEPARLAEKLAALATVPASSDHAPTKQHYKVFEHLSALADEQTSRLHEIEETDVAGFVKLVGDLGIPAIK